MGRRGRTHVQQRVVFRVQRGPGKEGSSGGALAGVAVAGNHQARLARRVHREPNRAAQAAARLRHVVGALPPTRRRERGGLGQRLLLNHHGRNLPSSHPLHHPRRQRQAVPEAAGQRVRQPRLVLRAERGGGEGGARLPLPLAHCELMSAQSHIAIFAKALHAGCGCVATRGRDCVLERAQGPLGGGRFFFVARRLARSLRSLSARRSMPWDGQ